MLRADMSQSGIDAVTTKPAAHVSRQSDHRQAKAVTGQHVRTQGLALAAVLLVPLAATAEESWVRAGCTPLVAVQSESCTLRQIMLCGDKEPKHVTVLTRGQAGIKSMAHITLDGALIATISGPTEDDILFVTEQSDLFSLEAMLANGSDAFDYTMAPKGKPGVRFTGETRATGESVVIDGRNLLVLEIRTETTAPDGSKRATLGRSLFDAEWNLVLRDTIADPATGAIREDVTPVDFILPEEEGFLSGTPLHGCTN